MIETQDGPAMSFSFLSLLPPIAAYSEVSTLAPCS